MKSSMAFFRQHVLPALLCIGVAYALSHTPLLRRFEAITFDLRTQERMKLSPRITSGEVVVIGIDEASIRDFGVWPWSREIHGNFLQLAGQIAPKVIGWDILFTEASEQDAQLLNGALRTNGAAVVFGAKRAAREDEGVPLAEALTARARLVPLPNVTGDRARLLTSKNVQLPQGRLAQLFHLAFVDSPAEPDGARRRVPLVVRIDDHVYPTLSLKSLMIYWGVQPEEIQVRLGDALEIKNAARHVRIPIDEAGRYLINYRYGIAESAMYGYSEAYQRLLARYQKHDVQLPRIRNRLLLVGQTSDGLTDVGPTPMSPLTPLVFVHANALENILSADFVRPVPGLPVFLGALALGIVGAAAGVNWSMRQQAVFSLGVPIAYALAALWSWIAGSWLFPVVGPVLGFGALQSVIVGRRVLAEQRAKEQIKGMFGTYLSPTLVNRLVASGEMPRLGGHQENITAYFSDIQGFSTFSEMLPPERLVELMNEYLTACTDLVQEEGGTLDKYIGDAVVAMFGAPVPLPDHAFRACVSACRVQQKLAELREKWRAEGDKWPQIVSRMQSRIGLNSGPCIVGNMGSRSRFNYTMMGDDVNLAARMESGAKHWGVYAMCTEATRTACEAHGGDRVVFRALGRIVVKGRSQAVPIHEIGGLRETLAPGALECIQIFDTGMRKFLARDWRGAAEEFRKSAALEPNQPGRTPGVTDNPSLIYQEKCAQFETEPPAEGWDGTHVMTEK